MAPEICRHFLGGAMISLLSMLVQIGIHATLGWNTKEVDEKVRDSVRDGKNRKVKMMLRYEWIYRKPEKRYSRNEYSV